MKKNVLIVVSILFAIVANAQATKKADDWATYKQMLKEIGQDWDDDHKFNYPKVFECYDKAFAAVAEPQLHGVLYTALQRAKESKNVAKYKEYEAKIKAIEAKVDQNYVKELMSFLTKVKKSDNKPDPVNYPKFVEFVKTKGWPYNYNKVATLKWKDYQKIISYIVANEWSEPANTTMVRLSKETLDKALNNYELDPYDYARIIDWQLLGQGKDAYYYMFTRTKGKNITNEEILKRRQVIGLEVTSIDN